MQPSHVHARSVVCAAEPLEGRIAFAATPAVYAPHSTVKGDSMSYWSREWLRWALSPSESKSPLTDSTGVDTNARQPNRVFFLAGTVANGESVHRTAYVKPNRPILFPVLNSFWVNFDAPGGDPPFAQNEGTIRETFHKQVQAYKNVFATVDGQSIPSLRSHVEHDPLKGVTIDFAENNIFGADPDDLGKAATEGIYVMLKPLSPGRHTVHFGGSLGDGSFKLDVTYTLNVVGPSSTANVTAKAAPTTLTATPPDYLDGIFDAP